MQVFIGKSKFVLVYEFGLVTWLIEAKWCRLLFHEVSVFFYSLEFYVDISVDKLFFKLLIFILEVSFFIIDLNVILLTHLDHDILFLFCFHGHFGIFLISYLTISFHWIFFGNSLRVLLGQV